VPFTIHVVGGLFASELSCLQDASFPRIYYLFRALGLRHLAVLDEDMQVRPLDGVTELYITQRHISTLVAKM